MYQLALGIVLFRHQVSQGMHFHWEQPARSLMLRFPGMAEVYQYTQTCQFDMCNAGDLKDPSNGMQMKKGMNVVTTSKTIYQLLHGRICQGNHLHQQIAGSFTTPQGTILRSRYTEVYPRKFAREVARAMMHNHRDRPFNWQVAFSHMCQDTDAEVHVVTKSGRKPNLSNQNWSPRPPEMNMSNADAWENQVKTITSKTTRILCQRSIR